MSTNSRTLLWSAPRSVSTAFFRSVESHSQTMVFLEPFSLAYHLGSERVSSLYESDPIVPNFGFLDVKRSLEEAGSQGGHVFVKDMAYVFGGRYGRSYDPKDLLPRGFRHTFLIRDPRKTVKSLYEMSLKSDIVRRYTFTEEDIGLKELWSLYELVRDIEEQNPLVIDADDLLQQPEAYIKAYCQHIGLPYEASMMNWKTGTESAVATHVFHEWFQDAQASATFTRSHENNEENEMSTDLPEVVLKCIENNLQFYRNLREVRLQLDS